MTARNTGPGRWPPSTPDGLPARTCRLFDGITAYRQETAAGDAMSIFEQVFLEEHRAQLTTVGDEGDELDFEGLHQATRFARGPEASAPFRKIYGNCASMTSRILAGR